MFICTSHECLFGFLRSVYVGPQKKCFKGFSERSVPVDLLEKEKCF